MLSRGDGHVTRAIKRVYDRHDVDRNGVLSPSEFKACMVEITKYLGVAPPSQETIDGALKEVDVNGDNSVTWDEFSKWYVKVYNSIHTQGSKEEAMFESQSIFLSYDKDHSGSLETAEFRTYLKDLFENLSYPKPTEDQINTIIQTIDKNKNGTIELSEFQDYWQSDFLKFKTVLNQ
eukprot:TRINITY_DN13625_c0_g1_i1.p1 TRINITY_DN13625_c0_g1~~TRINITY_DN13625_c0_g1_i1.p1  ORF type:complete len:177 (+),score=34.92 TRINITY_DN13625_c0_g1_i1:72-602(+)